jgi:Phage Tail Collar Domain
MTIDNNIGLKGDAGLSGPKGDKGDPGLKGNVGPKDDTGAPGSNMPDTRFGNTTQLGFEGKGRECTIGEVILSAGSVVNGLITDGRLLSIAQNAALFTLLGTTYGGNGTTTFSIPDLHNAAPNGLTYSICVSGISPARN